MIGRIALSTAFTALASLAALPSAHAVLHSIAAGAGVAVPMGEAYVNYGRAPNFLLQIEDREAAFSDAIHIVGTFEYTPLTLQNVVNGQIRISVFGLYAGLQYVAPSESASIHPFMSVQIGTTFNALSVTNSTNGIDNRSMAFATRLNPGVIIPVVDALALELGFPLETIFVKNTLFLWNAVGAVRIRL